MLILTRTIGEPNIVIFCPDGERITISLARASDHKARIGVDAPRNYAIYREELLRNITSGAARPIVRDASRGR